MLNLCKFFSDHLLDLSIFGFFCQRLCLLLLVLGFLLLFPGFHLLLFKSANLGISLCLHRFPEDTQWKLGAVRKMAQHTVLVLEKEYVATRLHNALLVVLPDHELLKFQLPLVFCRVVDIANQTCVWSVNPFLFGHGVLFWLRGWY